ncbi:MAG: hypothetical protein AABX70_04775 [Nanoarchaeota archaeon]
MNCICGKAGRVKLSYTQIQYCKDCFLKLILHRVKKELRQKKWFKGRDTVYLLNDKSKEYFIARWLLEEVFEKRMKIYSVQAFGKLGGKKIRPSNLDREVTLRLDPFLTGKKFKQDKLLHFPFNVTEEEVIQSCKLLGYKYKKLKQDNVHPLIQAMERRYPGTLFGLYRTFQEI